MRRTRGSVTLFFLLFALPLTWIAGAISVDYGKVATTKNQSKAIVDAAAIAAASALTYEGDPGEDAEFYIDVQQAEQYVVQVVCAAFEAGADRYFPGEQCESFAELEFTPPGTRPTAVEVTFNYRVDDLMFIGLAGNWADGSISTSLPASDRASASFCASGDDLGLSSCIRPR